MPYCLAGIFCFKSCLRVVLGASLGAATTLFDPASASLPSQSANQPVSQRTEQLASQPERQTDSATLDQITLSVGAQQAQLLDLVRFPLFLPDSQGARVADSQQPSLVQISQPSLTWLQDQLNDRYRRDFYRRDRSYRDLYRKNDLLVEQWQAYLVNSSNGDSFRYVDAIVNELVWDELNDFERYGVILQFGAETQRYGYQLRVFHSGDAANVTDAMTSERTERSASAGLAVLRGAYLCDFDQTIHQTMQTPSEPFSTDDACEVLINRAGSIAPI